MTSGNFLRRFTVAFGLLLVLGACGASEDTTEPGAANGAELIEQAQSATAPDDRTADEIAVGQIDLMLLQLGVTDVVPTSDCVVERLKSEGIDLAEQGPQLVAAMRCEPNVGSVLFRGLNLDVPDDENACVLAGLIAETARVPLAEAEAFFSEPTPPSDVLQTIATDCSVSLEDLEQGFG